MRKKKSDEWCNKQSSSKSSKNIKSSLQGDIKVVSGIKLTCFMKAEDKPVLCIGQGNTMKRLDYSNRCFCWLLDWSGETNHYPCLYWWPINPNIIPYLQMPPEHHNYTYWVFSHQQQHWSTNYGKTGHRQTAALFSPCKGLCVLLNTLQKVPLTPPLC